ncbi:alpha/beta hydrolase [Nocardia sp. CDC160]|uniref:alpha/beta hydrolase n=1 Tax=Nocardia sp. CDC160 TaxID=3112166 RepID=UPI002DBB530F|nr:alpha/beta hydrolase family protein [Nocardia sp. CDC160]MEC3914032.1 alpha/beta hydrolase family protein [Nocardia sp. CDC160]
MRFGRSAVPGVSSRRRAQSGWRTRLAAAAVTATALAVPTASLAAPSIANAAPAFGIAHRGAPGSFEELMVPSSMGPIKVQVQWAKNGGSSAIYMLDGMRAQDDHSAWANANEGDAPGIFANDDINVIMPVGGQSSFYADWVSPSNTNGQKFTYKWETFLTKELPDFLAGYGVSRNNVAVAGLSMGGSAALMLAAYHRDMFKQATSMSGYLNLSAPGMREAIRIAMLDAGRYNVDSMAAPWSPAWLRMDPFVFAPQLKNLPMFISSGNGIPGRYDGVGSFGDAFNTGNAIALEALSMVNTRAFQARLGQINVPAQFDFTGTGTHKWGYWHDELIKARPQILGALGLA